MPTDMRGWLALIKHIYQRYIDDGCRESAAALTYISLFAMVPLLTVMYAILSAVPAFQEVGLQIESLIFENFVPTAGQEVQTYLNQFSQQARKLSGVGVIFIGITAILMLKNIERTFNRIWHTKDNRSGLSSFLLYWAILSLGPLFIGLALGINTYLISIKVMFDRVDVLGITSYLLGLLPYLLTAAAFTLTFWAVPNCRVAIKNALIGGLITALVFELAKQTFATIVANTSYQTIYGTFATVPLFLMWIYLCWLILLAGAELVNALSGFSSRADERYGDFLIALGVLELLWRAHQRGASVAEQQLLRQRWLLGRYSISSGHWTRIREKLYRADLLRDADYGEFVLGRDLHQFTLWDLLKALDYVPTTHQLQIENLPAWYRHANHRLETLNQDNRAALSLSLQKLFSLESQSELQTVDSKEDAEHESATGSTADS